MLLGEQITSNHLTALIYSSVGVATRASLAINAFMLLSGGCVAHGRAYAAECLQRRGPGESRFIACRVDREVAPWHAGRHPSR